MEHFFILNGIFYMAGFFPSILGTRPIPMKNWEFQQRFVKIGKKFMAAVLQYNHCLGWHLQSFKHCVNILEFISFYNFITFNLEFFPVNWERKRYYFQLGIWPNFDYKISQKKSLHGLAFLQWNISNISRIICEK